MAWNIPGKNDDGGSGKDRRNPWKPRRGSGGNGGGLGGLFDNFRGMFDGGGGNPLRWIGLALVLWLAFNCFVLVAEQERGVVLRFGQFARILEPGPHFKLPWPVRSEEHTSELQSLMRISYAVFCLKKKTKPVTAI